MPILPARSHLLVIASSVLLTTIYLPAVLPGPRVPEIMPADVALELGAVADSLAVAYLPVIDLPADPFSERASRSLAEANVAAACHDFPDLPMDFGPGAHRESCREAVATYLGLWHASRAARKVVHPTPPSADPDLAWAGVYLDVEQQSLARFVYGPEEYPDGDGGYRDTLAAVWQNPLRMASSVLLADVLRRQGALNPAQATATRELASGVARAWYASWWQTGVQPSTGVTLVTRNADDVAPAQVESLSGRDVMPRFHHTLRWDADHGNSPAEEVAWLGAGVLMATRVLSGGLPAAERAAITAAASHYVDFAIAYDRIDRLHGGRHVRTLNAETTGGAYGQRRYWIENHTPDTPSIPYVGAAWHFIGLGLMASPQGSMRPWAELVPDEAHWRVMRASAEETMLAPDGTPLVDFRPGRGIGYRLAAFPKWTMPCRTYVPGRIYVQLDQEHSGQPVYVSEVGMPAGIDLVGAAWPLLRLAISQRDVEAYDRWRFLLGAITTEYATQPPDPTWPRCQVTPYSSSNAAYHWARMEATLAVASFGAAGWGVEEW